jgi:hypothetical protein
MPFARFSRVVCFVGVVALFGSMVVPTHAATITLPSSVVSQLAHQYSSDPDFGDTIRDFAESDGGGSGNYTQTGFSANMANYNEVIVRFEALAGERFAFTFPAGASIAGLSVQAEWAAGTGSASFTQATPAFTFEGLIGSAPTLNYNSNYVSDNGLRVGLEEQFTAVGDFSFSAVEVSFPYSHSVPSVVSTYSPNLFRFWGFADGSSLSDQTVLAVVPEPSTYAMALAGLACSGSVVVRRRRAL